MYRKLHQIPFKCPFSFRMREKKKKEVKKPDQIMITKKKHQCCIDVSVNTF